jgi:FtsP/CotA-like multicopper oxidase with cupredoxin domain
LITVIITKIYKRRSGMTKKISITTVLFCLVFFMATAYGGEMKHQDHEQQHHAPKPSEEMKEHGQGHEQHEPKLSEEMKMSKPVTKSKVNYMKTISPAGYDIVLGRKNPLPELKPHIMTDERGTAVKVFHLTVEDVTFEIFPGKTIQGWGFNGLIPGPTIRVSEGDHIRIILTNNTTTEHTLHIHGQKKSVEMDGVPYLGQKPLKKGESYTYEFEVQNPGTHWYHCHVDSAHHVDMGMYGAFIVKPKNEMITYDREYIMLLDEWPTAHRHIHQDAMPTKGHEEHGVVTEHPGVMRHEDPGKKTAKRDWYPETHAAYQPVYDGFSINGRAFPYTEPLEVKKGEQVRIRIINVGYKSHFMHSHVHKFIVVARSGNPVNEPQKIDTVEVGAGQRIDIILYADNPGIWPFHCHRLDHITNDHIYPGGMMTFIRYVE